MVRLIPLAALVGLALTTACTTPSFLSAPPSPAQVHERLLTIDTHVDTPLRIVGDGIDPGVSPPTSAW